MNTRAQAMICYRHILNDWYFQDDPATVEEVSDAFNSCFPSSRKAANGISYLKTFFKLDSGLWYTGMNTADREELANCIEEFRGDNREPDDNQKAAAAHERARAAATPAARCKVAFDAALTALVNVDNAHTQMRLSEPDAHIGIGACKCSISRIWTHLQTSVEGLRGSPRSKVGPAKAKHAASRRVTPDEIDWEMCIEEDCDSKVSRFTRGDFYCKKHSAL